MQVSSRGLVLIAALAVPLVSLTAAAESEVRPLRDFSAISVGGGIELTIRQGADFRVEAVTSSGSADAIVTTVEDGTLTIRMSRMAGFFNWFTDYSVDVTLPELTALAASGGSDVVTEGTMTGRELTIRSSGGSDVDARELSAQQASVNASGGADAALAVSERLVARASGGADIVYTGNPAMEDVDTSGGAEVSRR